MNRYLWRESLCGFWRLALAAVSILFTMEVARGVTLVQEFYLPMPEAQIYQANSAIIAGAGQTNFSTFSIVVTGDGTQVFYDHWEDGYEVSLASPSQSSTLVWGDGNNANGICPGFANDPSGIPVGTVITLTNNVSLPRNPAQILWDARDRVAATKALVISRAAWPIPTGPVFAGAVGVLSTLDYGTNYISPVGQDLTNNLFKYVGMFVMAAQNNTTVTVDTNGTGVGTFTIVLNQGESYLINGGIKKGGRITATKPVQADVLIGRVGASYASDWFTLYPVESWDNAYYTPVSSASSGTQPAYVYLYNPNTNAITITYATQGGSGSFQIPGTNGVYQFQMPIGSGASFVCAAGQNFFAVCTVAANNTADTSFNWGFTLVPKDALTTEATVGWGPGSADGTVNGSPVWVTALAGTTLYVDYKGDKAGPLTDPNGLKYDTNFTLVNLQSLKIYDPSKNQTGMRIYTVDGTLITAAWGEDADRASPGNPYIDAGTTVLPFPTPVILKTAFVTNDVAPPGLSIGDTVQYSVQVDNKGLLPLGNTVVIDAPSTNLAYVAGSTSLNGVSIADSPSGTPFPLDGTGYTIPLILSRGTSLFQYQFQVLSAGIVSNSVNIGGTTISANANILPVSTNGFTVNIRFTDTNGATVALYSAGGNVFVTLTNAVGNTSSNTIQTLIVTVNDATSGDSETITLTETGVNTGVFRNVGGLPTSLTSGLISQDGTLKVVYGDVLNVSYTEPIYGSSSSATAGIQTPAQTKQLYLSVNNSTNGTQALNRMNPVAAGNGTTRTSADIGAAGSTTFSSIGVDGAYSTNSTATSFTFNYATGGGTNRLMLVSVGVQNNSGSLPSVSTVTYNGTSLSLVASASKASSNPKYSLLVYALLNPPAGTASVAVNWSGGNSCTVGVITMTNVDQATPFNSTNTAAPGTAITVNSSTNQLVFGAIYNNGAESLAAGQNAVTSWTNNNGSYTALGNTLSGSNAPTTSISWTASAYAVGVSINPSSSFAAGVGGPATNVTSFVQTPVFATSFTMPSNNFVTITNYITLTNGSFTPNPDVTARLQFNNTPFLTLTNPIYNSASNTLVWSAVLPTNVTVPSGTNIVCLISNGVENSAFHINYDSTNAPSKITFPTATVISISTLGVYDAPYPGGSLVTTPIAGTTLYVRAVVADPFGSYDITSLGLAFTAPNTNNNFSVLLTDSSMVASNAATKTYEYVWATGPATGNYVIAATANEGSEGVTASASAGISTIFLDLGTPSTTEFTSGNNGSATNAYLANSTVCFRVTDLNRNTNAATAQSIIATLTSSGGDSESVTLFETGTNTGIFTTCINTLTNAAVVPNDGTLSAPVGSVLTISYSDPTDSSDNTSATATIQPVPGVPGMAMNKTIVTPSGGQVGVNQPVVYSLQVVNTGSTVLTNVAIVDTFSANRLVFGSASVTPNVTNSTTLTWTNLGNFNPGQSTNISVTFTTTATGTATNFARATSTAITNSSIVSITVNSAALNVVKILLPPTNQPVAVGSNVTFRITIQNVGNTTINYLPFSDTFSGAYYQYVSATIVTNSAAFGLLYWTNLAAAPLLTNAVITNDIVMRVVGAGTPANNTATADFATDIFGNPVPTATSTVGVNTASAAISGSVINDTNQNGALDVGEAGISGVTVQLYTDPNGDGNPADGALIQVTTSGGGGYYELLNLNFGNYVVVETDPLGFSSSSPVNNRLAVGITNLVTYTNRNFFDFIPAPSVYSTFSGKVFNDTNGFGTNLTQAGLSFVTVDLVQDVNSNGVADSGEPVVGTASSAANGAWSIGNISPGYYVLRETDLYGYYSSGDSQPPNNNQIFFNTTNGITSTNRNFFDRLLPVANADTNSALLQVPVIFTPLTNDVSPNGDPLTLTNLIVTGGTAVVNAGFTNLTFTPTNLGPATITYTAVDKFGGSSNAVITINVTALADIAIGKTAAASVLAAGNLTYTLAITNLGPTPASSVTVTDTLPANVTFVSASGNGATNGGFVIWSLGTLAANQISNLTLIVTAPASGSLTNTASAGSPDPDPTPTNNVTPPVVTTVTPAADVSVTKTGPAGITLNTNYNYSLIVSNGGPSTATSLIVIDSLPNGLVFVSSVPSTTTNASNQVIWNVSSLAPNAISNFTLTVLSTQRGSLTNVASVGGPTLDPTPTNNLTPPVVTLVTNFPPLANPDGYAMTENTTNTFSPLTNDVVRTPGGTLTIISVTPTNGTASISGTNIIFIPTLNFTGIATIGYTITDNVGGTNSSVITVNVTNIPPIANPDNYSVGENSTNNLLTPLLNDTVQTIGGSLSLVSVVTTNGSASVSGTNVLFTPATNFLGVTTLTYTISDGIGGSSGGIITVTVTNRAPVAVNDSAATPKNISVSVPVLANDFDPDFNPLTLTGVAATNGFASISGTNVIFTPTNNFLGITFVGYTITDGNGATNSAVVTVTVTNRFPVAVNDSTNTAQNVAVTIPVLVNDTDPDGDALFIITVSPTNGTANISGANIIFTPATNFLGTATIGYLISDGYGGSSTALVTIGVTNRPPVANPDSYGVTENTTNTLPVLVNDVVVTPGGTLTIISVTPTNGTASISGTNIIFIPTTNFLGTATIGYTITDGIGGTNSTVVTVTVTNIPPLANPDGYTVFQNSTNTFSPLTNDVVRTPGGTLSLISVTPTNGTATISGTNIIFTPTPGFTGTATIGYTITDGIGGTNSTVITVTVQALADIAVSKTGATNVFAGTNFTYTITVTNFGPGAAANLSVTDNLPALATFVSSTAGATLTGSQLVWTNLGALAANAGTNLTVTVTAPLTSTTLTNLASGGSPTSDPTPTNNISPPVTTTVTPVADVSLVKLAPASVLPGTNFNYTIIVSNAGPSSAASLSVTDNLPANITFVSATAGYVTNGSQLVWTNLGTLLANTTTNLSITVTAPLRGGITNTASAGTPTLDPIPTNNVTPPITTTVLNVGPVAVNDSTSTPVNIPVTVFPLVNDFDTNGDAIFIVSISATNGSASFTTNSVLFTPTANFLGTATVGYTISDGNGGTNSAIIFISVTNRPPVANNDSVSGTNGFTQVISPLGNDTDPDGDTLTITSATTTNGIVTINGGNTTLTFTPTNGSTTINYTISDGRGGSASAVITVNVGSVADLFIAKTAPATVFANSNLTYSITVSNFGPSSASSVIVTDTLPANITFVSASGNGVNVSGVVTWNLGTLASAQSTNLTVTVTAPATGSLTNFASVGSPTPDPVPTNNVTPPVPTTVTELADLRVGKTGNATVFANSNLTYTITVTNFGPSSASSVTVTDALPNGVTFVSASNSGTTNGNDVIWNLGTLTSNQVSSVTLTVTAPASGSITNVATVGSPTGDPIPTNNVTPPVTTTVTPVADLAIFKFAPASVNASNNFSYTITVTNSGPSSASGVIVTDTLPVGVTSVVPSGNGVVAGSLVTWNLGTLVATQSTNLTVSVTAPPSGTLTNFASVGSPTGDPVPTNNVTPPVTTDITPVSDVSIVKTAPAGALFGTNFNYSIIVSNGGPSTATSLIVTDSLPNGLAFVSSVPSTTTNASNQVIWNISSLAANTASNFTLTVISTLRGSATNVASVGGPTLDPIPTNNFTPPVVTIVTNFPPLANPDNVSITENTTGTFTPLTNDVVRNPGGNLTIIGVSTTNGVVNFTTNTVMFTPATNFIGVVTLTYTITDNVGGTNSSVITVNVTNIPPVANPDSFSMAQNTTNTFGPMANDFIFTPGSTFNLVSVSTTNGTASVSGTNVIFTPANNFLGTLLLNYTMTDGVGGTNSSTITVTVTNVPPLANPDFYSMAENTTNTFTPLTNDVVRTPGGVLSIVSVTPTNGAASFLGTNVTFIPTLNFVGIATIGYTITDGIGGTNSSVITVTVTNQSPIAFPQNLSTTENTALPITLTGSDPVSRPLTFIVVSAPTGGTLTLLNTNTGAVTYTPTNNFTGTDSFVFRVNNGVNNSSNATITINVTPTADLLVQQSGPTSGVAGNNLTFTVAVTNLGPASMTNVVVTNALDAGYTFVSASGGGSTNGNLVTWTIPILPANGKTNFTVTLLAIEGGTFTNIASGISITPDLNATNNNGSLTNAQVVTTVSALADVAVFKTGSTNVLAGGTVNYSITATNAGPSTAANVLVQDRLPLGATAPVASGNYFISNNVIVWDAVTLPGGATTNYTVTLTAPASGTLTNIAFSTSSTPDSNTNNNNGSSTNSVVRTPVTPVADLAVGKSGAAATALGANFTYTISVTNLGPSTAANFAVTDSLPSGIVFVSAVPSTTTNAINQVIWSNLGTLAVNATTNLALTVKAVTRGAVTNIATVGGPTLDPTPTNNFSPPVVTSITNRPPVANNDSGSTPKNVAITIPALANDSDPDGDALTIVSVAPTNGTANISGTNVVFTPANNFIGTATIGYVITDGFGGTNSALITITVTNRAPVANPQSTTTPFNTAKPLTLTGSDADGDALTYIIVSAPSGGTLTLLNTNTGTLTYTPTNNFTGVDTFTFRVNDGTTDSATATVSITVGTPIIADLAVFKTGPTNGVAGSNLVYSITITNLGTGIATNVLVSDQLPNGFTFVSATPANVTVVSNLVTWSAFKLAPNTKTNFTVTAFSLEGGTFTNIAFATSDAFDPNPTNNNGTATNSQARTAITALADVQAFKDGGTNVAAGGTVNYVITATNAGPSTATNVIVQDKLPPGSTFQTASAGFTYSAASNTVTWPALTLTNGQSVNFTLALTAPLSGTFTNIVLSTSPTPDPNLTNNNGTLNKARVATKVVPYADLVVLLYGPTNVVQGSNFVYSLILSNAGPSVASNAFASDLLPPSFIFIGATSGGVNSNGIIRWPKIGALGVGATSNYFITVNSPNLGTFTNIASAIADTLDPNSTNNTGVAPASQALTIVSFAQFAWLQGTPIFNPQTGLYEETVIVTNMGNGTVAGFQLYVTVLTPNVSLWNATGTNGGVPYVQYNSPLDPSNHVSLILEFYDPARVPFTNTLQVVPIIPAPAGNVGTNGSVNIDKIFTDTRTNGTRFVIEFVSVPGKTYTVIYSSDLTTWKVATPSVTASANVTQWYDDGPPKTESLPMSVTNRFYRVIKN